MITFLQRKCVLFCAIFLILNNLQAQKHYYTLNQLVNASQAYLPLLKQQQSIINSAQANVTDVKHSFLPQLKISDEINIGTDNSAAGAYLPIITIPSASGGIRANNNYQPVTGNIGILYGEYELANFGLTNAKIKAAESLVSFQKSNYEKQLYEIKLQVCQLYFNLLQNKYRLLIDKQNIDRYNTIFTVIQSLAASGIKAGADSSLAKAELSSTKISYNQTLGRIETLKQQLAYLTGISSVQINIDTLQNTSLNNSFLPNLLFDSVSNPLIDFYSKKKNIFLSNETLIKKSYLPKVTLGATTWARGSSIFYNDDYKSLANGLGYQRFNYVVGVAITYDLFNGIHKRDKLNVNNYQIQASDFELQQQKIALQSSSLQADEALKTTMQNLAELPVQLQAAQDVYFQKQAQYKAGLITLIDLTNAAFVLYRSQTDYVETLSNWYAAKLNKAAATNNLDLFIQNIK